MINPQWRGASLCTSCSRCWWKDLPSTSSFTAVSTMILGCGWSWNATLVLGCAQQALLWRFSRTFSQRIRACSRLSTQRSPCTIAGRLTSFDDDVKVGCLLKNVADESLRDHLVLQSKRLTTCTMVRDEIMHIVQARAATGWLTLSRRAKARTRNGKVKARTTGNGRGCKSKAKDNGVKSQDSKDSAQKKSSTATASVT